VKKLFGRLLLLFLVVGGTAILSGRRKAPWLLLATGVAINNNSPSWITPAPSPRRASFTILRKAIFALTPARVSSVLPYFRMSTMPSTTSLRWFMLTAPSRGA